MRLFSARCTSLARLDGKTAVITGCNTGIGKITAKDFFLRGARVVMACRSLDKANVAVEEIKKECEGRENLGELCVTKLDLMSLQSVRDCARNLLATEKNIHLLINNAGVMLCPAGKTEDGYDIQLGVNHLGHFLLTLLLLPKIIKSQPGRIVNVSSVAHVGGRIDFDDMNFEKQRFSSAKAYSQSKLANILFTRELARRLQEAGIKGVNTYSLHPGVIATDLGRHLDDTYMPGLRFMWRSVFSWFVKTPEQGAQTTIYCAVDEKCANETGLYYAECGVSKSAKQGQNMEDAKRLWEESLKLVKLPDNYNPFKVDTN